MAITIKSYNFEKLSTNLNTHLNHNINIAFLRKAEHKVTVQFNWHFDEDVM